MLRVRFTNTMCIITKVSLHSIVPKMTKGNEILGYATRLTLVIFVCWNRIRLGNGAMVFSGH